MFKKAFLLFLLTVLVTGCLPTDEKIDGDNRPTVETAVYMIGSTE